MAKLNNKNTGFNSKAKGFIFTTSTEDGDILIKALDITQATAFVKKTFVEYEDVRLALSFEIVYLQTNGVEIQVAF